MFSIFYRRNRYVAVSYHAAAFLKYAKKQTIEIN